METWDELLEQAGDTVRAIQRLTDKALEQYTALVDAVAAGRICEQRKIERIMDGLLDFGDDARFLALYRKLCRHVYDTSPAAVGESALRRAQFEDADAARPK